MRSLVKITTLASESHSLEIAAYNALPTADRKLTVLPHTTHMTLYSDRAKLDMAAREATEWFAVRLLGPDAA
jgi:uncharacterized protein